MRREPVGVGVRNMRDTRKRTRPAFTLIELLVVISILMLLVTLLVAMLIPALARARDIARRAMCLVQMRGLGLADTMYLQDWRCFAPPGYGPGYTSGNYAAVKWFWWQKEMLGKYINEDIPRGTTQGLSLPPKKSGIRCPSRPVRAGANPDASWIGMNSEPAYEMGTITIPEAKCFVRGPKEDEFKIPPAKLALFMDSTGSGNIYICNWAYAGTSVAASTGYDPRHLGSGNYALADGHAQWYQDADATFLAGQIRASHLGGR